MSVMATSTVYVAVLTMVSLGASASGASPSARPGEFELLNDQSFWRFHAAWRTPATVRDGKYDLGGGHAIPDPGTRWILNSFTEPTPPAPVAWTACEFDDSGWRRLAKPPFGGYGYGAAADIYIVCARARFAITDPAKAGPLTLRLTYRGGVAVYLNGREIARGHMPSGKIAPLTLARDYAKEVFVGPEGAALPTPRRGKRPPEAFREGLQITEAVLRLRAASADPRRRAAIAPELAAEAKATIQVLMDVMESNRRVRPAGTADVWPIVRRIYRLVSETSPD